MPQPATKARRDARAGRTEPQQVASDRTPCDLNPLSQLSDLELLTSIPEATTKWEYICRSKESFTEIRRK